MVRTLIDQPRWEKVDKSQLPVATAVEHYLTTCRTEGKTPKTLRDYREKLGRFVAWHNATLGEFDLATAREFVAHLQSSKKWSGHPGIPTSELTLSAQSVAGYVRTLKGFGTWLFEEGYTEDNVLRRLAKPKVPVRVMEVLTDDEVRRLLGAVDGNSAQGARDLAILVLFLDTGLRLSELVGLRVAYVHLEDGWLKILGKGEKERVVPFGARATKVLNRYLCFFRPAEADGEVVFVNADGGPITHNTIKMLFVRLRQRSGLPRLHPHLLRHTFATTYLMAGGDVFSLQTILGHTTLEMTRRYVTLASSHIAIQHRRFSPMDRIGGPGFQRLSNRRPAEFRPRRSAAPVHR